MDNKFSPYKEYKSTNISWLPKIPSHWKLLPGKACFTEKKTPNKGMLETKVLSLSYGQLVVKPEEKLHGLVPESFETYQIVEPGDIIFRTTDLQNDWNSLRFGINRHKGIITSAYMCLRSKPILIDDYGHQILNAYDLMKIFYGMGSGLRQNIDWRDIKYLPVPVPPLEEQNAIVRFLDYTDRRIKRYIHAKQKLIKLLEEEKQAIIHQAVTRGLNPDVPMKPSGVDWLGDIPEKWEIVRLRNTVKDFSSGIWGQDPNGENEIICIRVADFDRRKRRISLSHHTIRSIEIRDQQKRILSSGDLLLEKSGGGENQPVGNVMLFDHNINSVFSNFITKLSTTDSYDPYYLCYLHAVLSNKKVTVRSIKQTTGIQNLDINSYLNEFIPSPSLLEQKEIYSYLEDKTNKIDAIQDDYFLEITLLQEYRTRLIADVVTGKLDVREAAAHLPEELEEEMDIEEPEVEDEEEVQEELDP